ncbi:MAG: MoxR family ATPase [Planctomycetota bacterium]|nr:MAG: MoxR family ATPase [Planctomycetota bacterium]
MIPLDVLQNNIRKAFSGDEEVLHLLLVALISGGHILIEDVPGVGKTTLAKALAKSISATFARVQFTPDLLPSDILGISIYSPKNQDFIFKKGPIFSHILLADELNRTSPRTQSALLEAMNEGQVTVDGNTYPLDKPFMVLATQNPMGFDGTYSLPEAQLDRFFMKIHLGYPKRELEREILGRIKRDATLDLKPVLDLKDVLVMQDEAEKVEVHNDLISYILDIVEKTRHLSSFLGISPRGALALKKASQSYAYLQGRNYVIPDDIRKMAIPVLAHRLIPKDFHHPKGEDALREILDTLPCPK